MKYIRIGQRTGYAITFGTFLLFLSHWRIAIIRVPRGFQP